MEGNVPMMIRIPITQGDTCVREIEAHVIPFDVRGTFSPSDKVKQMREGIITVVARVFQYDNVNKI